MLTLIDNPLSTMPPEYWEYAFKKALGQLTQLIASRKQAKIEEDVEKNIELHKSGIVSWFLYHYYKLKPSSDPNIYRINKQPYHLYVKPQWSSRIDPANALRKPLDNLCYKLPDFWLQYQNRYLEYLKEVGRKVSDAQTFRLLDIYDNNEGFELRCGLGSYFGYLSTCEILSDELLAELRKRKLKTLLPLVGQEPSDQDTELITEIKNKLYVRELLAPNLDYLLRWNFRDLKIGIDVFLVINSDKGPLCFLYHRGKNIGEYPDINHIMPAGTFQHDSEEDLDYEQIKKAFDLKYKILSELWEECFEGKDIKTQGKMKYRACIDLDKMTIPNTNLFPIKDLMVLMGRSEAFLFVTGFGMDLLSAKPDVAVLLVINDPGYERIYRDYWKVNWEFQGYGTNQLLKGVHFCYLNEVEKIKLLIKPGNVIPIGAMAVNRGMLVLKQLASEGSIDFDVPEWED